MKRSRLLLTTLVLAAVLVAQPADAWGPRARQTLVNAAMRLISREGQVPLAKLDSDVINGAGVSSYEVTALYPSYADKPVEAIKAEMNLLRAVRGEKVSSYFAYRLGVLGALVAQATSPMAQRRPTYRDLYYADVDENIKNISLKAYKRTPVDLRQYFDLVRRSADLRGEVYEKEYQEGLGFRGTAKASLSEDISRSVAAVIDVWYAVALEPVARATTSEAGIQDYIVGALKYYVQQGKEGYIEASYDKLMALTRATPQLHERIGDMFYETQYFKRAIAEYDAVIEMDPGNKEVASKVSGYHVGVGETALADKRLEDALDAFSKALEAEPLHPTAESRRLLAAKRIDERQKRLAMAQDAVQTALALCQRAKIAAADSRQIAQAITLYGDAKGCYEQVPQEFAPLFNTAQVELKEVIYQLDQLKKQLVLGGQSISGAGFMGAAQAAATNADPGLENEAMRSVVRDQLERRTRELRRDLEAAFTI